MNDSTASRPQRAAWRRRLLIVSASAVATAFATELGAIVYTSATDAGRGVVYDADYGWRHLPRVRKSGPFWGADEPATTNSHGWRDRETAYAKPSGTKRIVAVGDSFTFGVSVDYGERFTEVLEDELDGLDVVNLGANAYGTDQELLVLEREGLRYEPDVVVQVAFLGNDLTDILYDRKNHWPKPHFTLRDGALELVPPVETWDVTLRTSSYVGEGLFRFVRDRIAARHVATDAPDPRDLFVALVERARRVSEASGAEYLLVLVYSRRPSQPDGALPLADEQAIRERMARTGVHVLDTWDLFRARGAAGEELYAPDQHWNAAGHRVLADAIAARLRGEGWL